MNNSPIVIIQKGPGGVFVYMMLRQELIMALDQFISERLPLATTTEPLIPLSSGGKIAHILQIPDEWWYMIIQDNKDVTQEVLNEAWEVHSKRHNN